MLFAGYMFLLGLDSLSLRVFAHFKLAVFLAFFPLMVTAAGAPQNTVITSEALLLAAIDDSNSKKPSNSTGKDQQPHQHSSRLDFRRLDAETEVVLKEVLNLGSDLAIIEEREVNPAQFQVFVIVTMEPTNLFELDMIELRIDQKVVAAHYYTDSDVSAMSRGGVISYILRICPLAGTSYQPR